MPTVSIQASEEVTLLLGLRDNMVSHKPSSKNTVFFRVETISRTISIRYKVVYACIASFAIGLLFPFIVLHKLHRHKIDAEDKME